MTDAYLVDSEQQNLYIYIINIHITTHLFDKKQKKMLDTGKEEEVFLHIHPWPSCHF